MTWQLLTNSNTTLGLY